MDSAVIEQCLEVLAENPEIKNVDITGGEPELNPHFEFLVTEAGKLDKKVTVRHNLSVIFDGSPQSGGDYTYLPEFFAGHGLEIIASLPHYDEADVAAVRGQGVFDKSIRGLRLLNRQGYGDDKTGLVLNLMYNADMPLTPADRDWLESDFKQRLLSDYGVTFNCLYTVTNMPINRYREFLVSSGKYESYMDNLVNAFSPDYAPDLACRSLVSVDYTGRLYDCDFNLAVDLPVSDDEHNTIFSFDYQALLNRDIRFADHCYGCAAGGGGN